MKDTYKKVGLKMLESVLSADVYEKGQKLWNGERQGVCVTGSGVLPVTRVIVNTNQLAPWMELCIYHMIPHRIIITLHALLELTVYPWTEVGWCYWGQKKNLAL